MMILHPLTKPLKIIGPMLPLRLPLSVALDREPDLTAAPGPSAPMKLVIVNAIVIATAVETVLVEEVVALINPPLIARAAALMIMEVMVNVGEGIASSMIATAAPFPLVSRAAAEEEEDITTLTCPTIVTIATGVFHRTAEEEDTSTIMTMEVVTGAPMETRAGTILHEGPLVGVVRTAVTVVLLGRGARLAVNRARSHDEAAGVVALVPDPNLDPAVTTLRLVHVAQVPAKKRSQKRRKMRRKIN